jgi:hypothetical protein
MMICKLHQNIFTQFSSGLALLALFMYQFINFYKSQIREDE